MKKVITINIVQECSGNNNVNWGSFLWYITDFVTITDFDEKSCRVIITSDKHSKFLSKMIREYHQDIEEHNYYVARGNDLWEDHKKGAESNYKILKRLIDNELD